jgi:4-carboxymuconolactone decarboxylase
VSPRLEPIADPSPDVADLLATMPQRGGRPLNVFATMAHHPRLLKRLNVFGGLFLAHGSVPLREREIVILRTAWRAGSEYEFGQHTLIARAAGMSEADIAALADGDHQWSEDERLLIDTVDQLDRAATVAEPTWSALRRRWGDAAAMELIMLAGFYRMLAGFLNSLEVERDPGVPGWPT